ncbi:16S rRNA (uracil(1498)-N(3))-methyltransferase [bacterium]|nr:16S rRNA (uracil(1498)-N(3))-methyltransferase [bacterium]
MPHFFINSNDVTENIAKITDRENLNHIVKSLRTKNGEKLLLIDENKIQYETIIQDISKDLIVSKIIKSYPSKRFLDFDLYLAQSPLRSDSQTFIMEKATELGVKGVYPVYTDNCALKKDVITKKIEKWQKTMFEASKQCERAFIPKCFELTTIQRLVADEKFDKIIAFCERITDKTLRECFMETPLKKSEKVLVIIGPEGGFSDREFEFFKNSNIEMLTLGDLILKAETAVIVGLGNIIYEYTNQNKNI